MKKTLLLGLAAFGLTVAAGTLASTIHFSNAPIEVKADTREVFLNFGIWHDEASAEISHTFACHYWGGVDGAKWAAGSYIPDSKYVCSFQIPTDCTGFLFTHGNSGHALDWEPSWSHQTVNLAFGDASHDYYTIINEREGGNWKANLLPSSYSSYSSTMRNGYFLVGSMNNWVLDENSYSSTGEWDSFEIGAGERFKVVKRDYDRDTYLNTIGDGDNAGTAGKNDYFYVDDDIYVRAGFEGIFDISMVDGKIKIDDPLYAERTGYYIVKWGDPNVLIHHTNGPSDLSTYYCTFENVSFEKDETFKIYWYNGLQKDQGSELGAYGKIAGSQAAAFTNSVSNDFQCVVPGEYNIEYRKSDGKCYFTYSDRGAVRNFVATYIDAQSKESYAGMTDEERATKCGDKYSEASAAFGVLSPEQQSLFTSDPEFADAYAAYLEWEEAATRNNNARIIAPIAENNSGVIITASSIGTLALLGGAILYLRKRPF